MTLIFSPFLPKLEFAAPPPICRQPPFPQASRSCHRWKLPLFLQLSKLTANNSNPIMKKIKNNIVLLLVFLFPLIAHSKLHRILHEPLFPIQWTPPPPQSDPPPQNPSPFFPDPPPQSGSIQTPNPPAPISHQAKHSNSKSKLIILITVAISFFALFVLFAFFFFKKRTSRSPLDTHKLISSEDGRRRQTSMPDLLYLGTMEPQSGEQRRRASESSLGSPYRKLNSERVMMEIHHPSPDLQPLPPLVGATSMRRVSSLSNEGATFSSDDDGFYTPHRSLASMTSESPNSPRMSGQSKPRSRRTSPRMQFKDSSPSSESQIKHAIPMPNMAPPPPPPPPPRIVKSTRPPLPPPLPSCRRQLLRPLPADRIDVGFPPSRVCNGSSDMDCENGDDLDEDAKPKLKQLHWDKVRANSDRATVWDQMKSSSFKLNEDMIETLFMSNGTNPPPQVTVNRKHVQPQVKQENRMLDPKKSQNIAILLRALNVTREDVTDGLLNANPDGLGPELLETLVKMAPTKEEESILRDYNGDVSKLGPAEKFLQAVLDIPFAFKRVDAMLYRANFDSEIKYLKSSFQRLEAACEDLHSSRLFLKLLEAVLKTGNRMNVGTNRGEAKAFKLDTLLKLADVKGTDGKTTLLHFVVQEIIRSEESTTNTSTEDPPSQTNASAEFRKQGLKIISGLSNELGNVKKAAGMDSDVLNSYLRKLESGLEKTRSVLQLEKSCDKGLKFFESIRLFINEAEREIKSIKDEEKRAMGLVKDITEYFHGDVGKEEAHPLRIFMVVRDFLSVLDNVCKEVKLAHERTVVGSARSFRLASSASVPVLSRYEPTLHRNSDESNRSS